MSTNTIRNRRRFIMEALSCNISWPTKCWHELREPYDSADLAAFKGCSQVRARHSAMFVEIDDLVAEGFVWSMEVGGNHTGSLMGETLRKAAYVPGLTTTVWSTADRGR